MTSSTKELYSGIIDRLENKAKLKQEVYRNTVAAFGLFKQELAKLAKNLNADFGDNEEHVEITFTESGDFEAQLKFSGDVLIASMHTNVFTFTKDHPIQKLNYIVNDPANAYFGVIQLHNFLADTLKYNRQQDSGYLLARIFVNKEMHFMIEGVQKVADVSHDLAKDVVKAASVRKILEKAVIHCMDFELLVPPFEQVKILTLEQKLYVEGATGYPTDKHIGYKFKAELEQESKKY